MPIEFTLDIPRTFKIRRPVTNELYETSELIWRSGKKVTVQNLTKLCDVMDIRTTSESIEDMVQICDFLDMVCPAL